MTDPSKPDQPSLLSRLPAVPPRPGSRSRMPAVGREEAAKRRLTTRLEAIPPDVDWPAFDPRTVAVASMMVANFVGQDAVRMRFLPLVSARMFDPAALDDLPVAARFVLRILPKLGAELHERTQAPPVDVLDDALLKHSELRRVAERTLMEVDEAHGRLVTVRLGQGNSDVVYDLRMLADLVRDYRETLETEAGPSFRPEMEREAREAASRLEMSLIGPLNDEDREWRAYMLRALAMLVPLYEEVCRAGRFLFYKEKPEARFPALASVARVRRRLQREMARNKSGAPPPMIASSPPASRQSSRPRNQMKSIPPEVSLIEVSQDEDEAMAGAMVSAPKIAVVPAVPVAPTLPEMDDIPAYDPFAEPPPAADPFAGTSLGDALLDAVTLDFSPTPGAAEDSDLDANTAEIDIELTEFSDSNFYADIAGADVGLFVATYVVKGIGTPLAVKLTLPQLDDPIIVSGTVEWVREFSPAIEAPPGMGIALKHLPSAHRDAIDEFMKMRSPILHDL